MKFGETFMEYLQGDQGKISEKYSPHVEYKRLKKVLKSCRSCRASALKESNSNGEDDDHEALNCQFESCQLCDQKFFSELKKEASDIAGCFSSRVRRLLQLHTAPGMQKYLVILRQCFKNDQQAMMQECQILIEYAMMNAIAMQKILKKYDKVHCSVNGRNFKSKMRAERLEILQSPWLIELGALYLNFNESNGGKSNELFSQFSCNLSDTEPIMTLMFPDSVKLEYNLTCPICLDMVFNPYALGCGHLFCKSCACSAASVMIFQGIKAASKESKCPVCREVGTYANAVHMMELDLLLKKRYKQYWKERHASERAESVKQSRQYWDLQTRYVIGY
ncbi:PREDICTED: probable E3 ubiquitin-protein ligase BAH1-like [Nicotiana attenuata]|uniref:RING-type E3 ubiquitin transferase n=1 Tax=Nicotiana attenuata TaxID=49451 RepID=A0A1J6JME1_NICAT|nr:PREDICTED: probable E3 ubiquitin-protein ligase BAH1-like [Nicotiana attenuata]OIT08073.1 putative e3 ubiquitin-protein ligase bah1-like protein [Nicotiana attenuata]